MSLLFVSSYSKALATHELGDSSNTCELADPSNTRELAYSATRASWMTLATHVSLADSSNIWLTLICSQLTNQLTCVARASQLHVLLGSASSQKYPKSSDHSPPSLQYFLTD